MLLGLHINHIHCGEADGAESLEWELDTSGELSPQLQTGAAGDKESPMPAQGGSGNSGMDGVLKDRQEKCLEEKAASQQ